MIATFGKPLCGFLVSQMPSTPKPSELLQEMKRVMRRLIEYGLADDTNPPTLSRRGSGVVLGPPSGVSASALDDLSYSELYEVQLTENAFLVRMLDGALIQMDYLFNSNSLQKHRLAFLPSPDLEPFFELQAEYFSGVSFLEAVGRQVWPVPIRIDFDTTAALALRHPAAHMTLGQYKHCRIPMSGPMRPAVFLEFVVSHFYSVPEAMEFPLDTSSTSVSAERSPRRKSASRILSLHLRRLLSKLRILCARSIRANFLEPLVCSGGDCR